MTLVLSVHSRESLWLVADRRLSYGGRRSPIDDAVKVMNLETTDGVGLLAYAGLGATQHGTQPSEWISAVLRGHAGLTFEHALGVLSAAANKELPKHLVNLPGGAHTILVPAFIRDLGPRLYTIDNVFDRRTAKHWYRYTSHQRTADPGSPPSVRIACAGSGASYLARKRGTWGRDILNLVKARDRDRVSDLVVADRLATLNYEAHQCVRGGTVGPRCIVVWRRRPGTRQALLSGGGQQYYTGVARDQDSSAIPTIVNGMDVQSIAGVLMTMFQGPLADNSRRPGTPLNLDTDEMNLLLKDLPSEPDEQLR